MEKIFFEEDNLKKFLEDRNHEKAKVTGEMEKIFANCFKFTLENPISIFYQRSGSH